MRQRALAILLCSVSFTALGVGPAAASTHDPDAEQRSFELVNRERASRGLARLVWDQRMAGIARDHSRDMASDGELRHNDDLPSQVGDFQALGENVGYGADAQSVHDAFMDSPDHRRIIVGQRYERVGIGAIRDGDLVWITQVFYTPYRDDPEPSPSPEPTRRRQVRHEARPAPDRVRAQSLTPVLPLRPPVRVRTRAVADRPTPRTLSMLDALAQIDGPVHVDGPVVARSYVRAPLWI